MPRVVTQVDLDAIVRQHRLVQAASNPDRPAFHVRNPSSRRKGVLTDNRVGPGGEVGGYFWLTSLPDRGSALLRRRPDLQPVGTGRSCVRVQDLGLEELQRVVTEAVDYLEL